jgi:hypothetical protein
MHTIADLAGTEEIYSAHLAEALHASQSYQADDVIESRVNNTQLIPIIYLLEEFGTKHCSLS